MTEVGRSVSIAVPTFRRPDELSRTLRSVIESASLPQGWELTEILVIDNDDAASARAVVDNWRPSPETEATIRYVHEPEPGVSAARNRALTEATSRILVFIDDDEEVVDDWPSGLIDTIARSGATLVGGPVRSVFVEPPPDWIVTGGFFDRPEPASGARQRWLRTGNLAIDLMPLRAHGIRFDPAHGRVGSEDVAFSLDAGAVGLGLGWSRTAIVAERVPPDRVTARWLVERERQATGGYVLATGRVRSRTHQTARALLTLIVRAPQGVGLLAWGTLTGQKHLLVAGMLRFARIWGTMEGLRGRLRHAYGPSAGRSRRDR